MLLRLAVLLNRSRNTAAQPKVSLAVSEDSIAVQFDSDWLEENPLTIAELEREQEFVSEVGYKLILE